MTPMTGRQFHYSVMCAAVAATLQARAGNARLAPPNTRKRGSGVMTVPFPDPFCAGARGNGSARYSGMILRKPPRCTGMASGPKTPWTGAPGRRRTPSNRGTTSSATSRNRTQAPAGTIRITGPAKKWRGLYGAPVVNEETGTPEVDLDKVLLLDDPRLTGNAQIAEDFGSMHDWAHASRIDKWITVNGNGGRSREVPRLARMRLRLVNSANARCKDGRPHEGLAGYGHGGQGMGFQWHDRDGRHAADQSKPWRDGRYRLRRRQSRRLATALPHVGAVRRHDDDLAACRLTRSPLDIRTERY